MKTSQVLTFNFDTSLLSPEGFQALFPKVFSLLDKEHSTNIPFLYRIFGILNSSNINPIHRFYALYLLFKITEGNTPILAFNVASNSLLMEFIQKTAQYEANLKIALDERGKNFFSRTPSDTEATIGRNFVRLALESLILWKRKYGDPVKKPWRAFEIEDHTLRKKVEHFPYRYYHFLDKDYDLFQDLATWNYLGPLPRIITHTKEAKKVEEVYYSESGDWDNLEEEDDFIEMNDQKTLVFLSELELSTHLVKQCSDVKYPIERIEENNKEVESDKPICINLEKDCSQTKDALRDDAMPRSDDISPSSSNKNSDSCSSSLNTQEINTKQKKNDSNVLIWESQSIVLKGKSSSQRTPFVNQNSHNPILRSSSFKTFSYDNSPSSREGQNASIFTNNTSKGPSKLHHDKILNELQDIEKSIMKSRNLKGNSISNTPKMSTLKTSTFEKESSKYNAKNQAIDREARIASLLKEYSAKSSGDDCLN